MRLICPNCAAQYEVDASMIPASGRDVQCSSCGHTWFQPPEQAGPAVTDQTGVPVHDPASDVSVPPDVTAAVTPDAEPEPETGVIPAPPQTAPKPRPIDDAALEILRQEAAREAAARRREAGGALESQPDLGLGDPAGAQTRAAAAKARLARLRQQTPETEAPEDAPPVKATSGASEPATTAASRRELLPDIEEINSSLTATGERHPGDAVDDVVHERQARLGFRLGFLTVLLAMLVLMLIYLVAPQLGLAVPALTPLLDSYVNWVNTVRDLIDAALLWAVTAMGGNPAP